LLGTEQTPNLILNPIDDGHGAWCSTHHGTDHSGRLGIAFLGAQAACRWTLITALSMKISSESDFFVYGLTLCLATGAESVPIGHYAISSD